ncbi:MAG TPA: GDSL-type esterase/lipase family protein [Pyrinomonadaceae bacterium]|jgi:lysophospholipase L1-like esterase|nr:GDSL-type esterase/lipase family protein [Pyrinomonadaceae bacterium]
MKVIASPAKLLALAAIAALLAFPRAYAQTPKNQPINLLVLGDSISWGQGLKSEHKASTLVKNWLEQQTGREVAQTVEAHSGAVIGSVSDSPDAAALDSARALDGELSRAYPTINQQIDYAVSAFGNPGRVDLVIVNGCINDVDSRRLLNAANTPDTIRELAQVKCGAPVESLLMRIANTFPSAHVVVTGYYPIVSEKTTNDLFMRALAKRFYSPTAGAPKMSDKMLRARLIAMSREWYETSGQLLSAAARKVDEALMAKGSHQRVLFADAGFHVENVFAARETRLWSFDASWIRKMLVVFSLGHVQLRSNDELRSYRSDLCKNFFKRPADETPAQKATREDRMTRCRLAAVAHPNRKGAAMYAEAISNLLKPLIAGDGWLRSINNSALPQSPSSR